MYKISELVDKNLLDVNTACDLGRVADVAWNAQSGKCALVTVRGVYDADRVFSVKDAVSVVGATDTADQERLIDKLAYDTTGKLLGRVVDVEFGNSLKLAKIHLHDGTAYNKGKIYAVKDVMLVRARTPGKDKSTVKAPSTNEVSAPTVQKTASKFPMRKYGDFSFLVGKFADKNITNFQGELMIKNGEKVTPELLRQAKVSGKLIELCLHTK